MSIAYTPPEVRELGTLSALTLGSGHSGTSHFKKGPIPAADNHSGNTGTTGQPCTNTPSGTAC